MAKKNPTRRFLNRLIERSDSLIYFVDDQQTLRFANEALLEWLGADWDSLKDVALVYDAEASPEDKTSGLCPPPDLFESSENGSTFWVSRNHLGQVEFCPAVAAVIESESMGAGLWVVADPASAKGSLDACQSGFQATRHQLHLLNQKLMAQMPVPSSAESLVGVSAYSARLRSQVASVAKAGCSALIHGAFGCGKEQLARTVYSMMEQRTDSELAPIYCAVSDAPLIQQRMNDARVAMKHRNVDQLVLLLLDVDSLSAEGQSELLGFLQLPSLNISSLATSAKSLNQLLESDAFSSDLAYQISAVELPMLPLKNHLEDLPLLAQTLLEQSNSKQSKQLAGFSERAIEQLLEYDWPENLNELRRVVQAAVDQANGTIVNETDLPQVFLQALSAQRIGRPVEVSIRLDEYLASVERELVLRAMRQTRGNKTQAAKQLGISRPKLLRRLQQLGLHEFLTASSDTESQQIDPSAFEELVDE